MNNNQPERFIAVQEERIRIGGTEVSKKSVLATTEYGLVCTNKNSNNILYISVRCESFRNNRYIFDRVDKYGVKRFKGSSSTLRAMCLRSS